MNILVSNDDGIHAVGINALIQAVRKRATTIVVAPDRNRSGASNSLTLTRPIRARELELNNYAIEGTPTDCVHLALTGLIKMPVDFMVSGINHGANMGDDVLYSGTVAAAIEACNLGVPAIAFSLAGDNLTHIEDAAKIAVHIMQQMQRNPLPKRTILNVNIPSLPFHEIKGIQITRLGSRHCAEPIIETLDPRGKTIYWIGPPGPEADAGTGTDFHAIRMGYVSVTPINLDMTHYKIFDNLAHWNQSLVE